MLLRTYLNSPHVRRTLSKSPSQEGFSLIELVVVIAILGILIAIALPNFLNVQKEAKINQAKSALAQLVKECSVSDARELGTTMANITTDDGNLGDYQFAGVDSGSLATWRTSAGAGTTIALTSGSGCYAAAAVPAAPASLKSAWRLPGFAITYDSNTGGVSKYCIAGTASNAYNPVNLCDPADNPTNNAW